MKITVKQITQPGFGLPDGYSLSPTDEIEAQITIPGQALYGGADISRASDANGVLHMACCARGPDNDFRFRVFRYIGSVAQDIPLQQRASGRGEIAIDLYSGQMTWIAWEHNTFFTDLVPGAAPFVFGQPIPEQIYVPLNPNRYSASLDGQPVTGGRSLDMATLFDLPPNARAYCVRLVAQADRADVRVRLGTEQQPGQLTANTQAAGLQVHQVGIVNAGDGGRLWLSVANNQGQPDTARVWLTVAGYWPGGA